MIAIKRHPNLMMIVVVVVVFVAMEMEEFDIKNFGGILLASGQTINIHVFIHSTINPSSVPLGRQQCWFCCILICKVAFADGILMQRNGGLASAVSGG